MLPKGGVAYIKQQFDEDKLTLTEEVGDLVAPHDQELAMLPSAATPPTTLPTCFTRTTPQTLIFHKMRRFIFPRYL